MSALFKETRLSGEWWRHSDGQTAVELQTQHEAKGCSVLEASIKTSEAAASSFEINSEKSGLPKIKM